MQPINDLLINTKPVHLLGWTGLTVAFAMFAVDREPRAFSFSALGFVLFPLVEYLAHRFAGHSSGPHIHHHADPLTDVLTPFRDGILPTVVLLGLSRFFLSLSNTAWLYLGFLLSYDMGELIHWHNHVGLPWVPPLLDRLLGPALRFHLSHHRNSTVAFGFATPFWDWVFGTLPPEFQAAALPLPFPLLSFLPLPFLQFKEKTHTPPAPGSEDLARTQVLGLDLLALAGRDGEPLPRLVRDCVAELATRTQTRGLFRVPGSHETIQQLAQAYDRGQAPDLARQVFFAWYFAPTQLRLSHICR